jgi:hypothetical protein
VPVPTATSMVDSARRADRTLLAIVGVATVSLIVGAIAMFGPDSTSEAGSVASTTPAPVTAPADPVAPAVPVVGDATDDVIDVVDADQPEIVETDVPAAPEPDPEPEPPVVETPPADEPADADVPADAGDPDPDVPEVNPCMEAADEGQQFFVPDSIVLEDGDLGGSFRIGSCTPDPLALELTTVPGVLLSHSDFDLGPAGVDVHFIIVPEFFEDQDIEFKVKVYEVGCCADYIDIAAEKTWGLGELAPYDPGIFTMLTDTEGLDPNDADAVTEQFIVEYGWHPGYLDAPEAQVHDEAVLDFIEQYDVPSPWGNQDF